ncbi:RagB/SusD family nutrient uptake outer membrane protein [Tamlana fucoidanivorans]|uniref:RagB/SusD family nutrient uptake outer membrane protein n=1 Tax=Allotamlana fucoidanivorans TaxID=2583814 RepID=A0A5C4SNV1_9FLAO|nr:RagB/SusD family nutrient uptake outer membrane protein [Tamlana fucoidanivorans]TNJ45855.1 RagB/SusD family nutrient uptake outer membrane protein [Tamlana fucoidanivorans]
MIKYKYIILFLAVLLSVGCEDYLDRTEEGTGYSTEDEVWRDRNAINSMAYRLYDTLGWMFEIRVTHPDRLRSGMGKNYGCIEVFSGDVIFKRSLAVHNAVLSGDYVTALNQAFGNPDFYDAWYDNWELVYTTNAILDRIDGVTTDIMPQSEIDQVKGEALLFRAFAYHELSKRWGALPYIKTKILPETDLNLPRPTYKELIADIVADCDAAIKILPEVSYLNHPVNMGRMGKAAAMALKSRALTTAASPNYTLNNQKDTELWEMAAAAAWDLIQLSQTSDKVGLYQGDYNNIFSTEPGTIEGVWPRYNLPIAASRDLYRLSWLWRNIDGDAGYSPSQEIVDRFETADGWPIDHPSSGYNEQDPYSNRDPRFYKDILYHDAPFAKVSDSDRMDMRTTPLGEDRTAPNSSTYGNSATGYFVRKLIPEKYNKKAYNRTVYLNAPYIRMAEIYLNYAEAVNEAYDNPNAMAPGANLTAVDALNAVRNRVGHVDVRPEFTTNASDFREVVRNEFRVELCFEYHSWHDMLRWRTAKEELDGKVFHGMLITDDPSQPTGVRYERFEIGQPARVFDDRMYRYPIQQSDLEVYEAPKLTQNPGW